MGNAFHVEMFRCEHFRVELPSVAVPGLNPWYVTGLVEGEGTFTYSRSGSHLALYFAVKLKREFPRTCRDRVEQFAKRLSAASPRHAAWSAFDEDAGPYKAPGRMSLDSVGLPRRS